MAKRQRRAAFFMGYGIGDFGLNIYWNSLSLILVFWYADVVGLEPYIAGLIYAVGVFWDAISDPVIAVLVARNRGRHGVYRPFILYGGGALGLAFCLLFWTPPFEGGMLVGFLCLVHMLFRTCYTIVAVPYAALTTRLSFDSQVRTDLAGFRMIFAFLGLLAVSGAWFPLSRAFGQGHDSSPTGFFLTAIVAAVLATATLIMCFFLTEEKTPPGQTTPAGFDSFLRAFRGNPALRVLLLGILLHSAAVGSFNIPLAFFIEASMDRFAAKEIVMTAFAIVTLFSVPIWTVLSRKVGRKRAWLLATGWVVALALSLVFFGPLIFRGVPVQIILFGFGFGAFSVLVWSFIPDAVEYGQHLYGERAEGAVFGLVLFVQKFSGVIVGLVVGNMLSLIGYQSGLEQQAEGISVSLERFMALVPSSLLILAAIVITRLPLDRHMHKQIVEELSA